MANIKRKTKKAKKLVRRSALSLGYTTYSAMMRRIRARADESLKTQFGNLLDKKVPA